MIIWEFSRFRSGHVADNFLRHLKGGVDELKPYSGVRGDTSPASRTFWSGPTNGLRKREHTRAVCGAPTGGWPFISPAISFVFSSKEFEVGADFRRLLSQAPDRGVCRGPNPCSWLTLQSITLEFGSVCSTVPDSAIWECGGCLMSMVKSFGRADNLRSHMISSMERKFTNVQNVEIHLVKVYIWKDTRLPTVRRKNTNVQNVEIYLDHQTCAENLAHKQNHNRQNV